MDSDLQDPPEMIKEFIAELEECDVVIAQRRTRMDSGVKKLFANIFYKVIGKLSDGAVRANVGDFWALSERAKDSLLRNNEELKFLRGLVSQLGSRTKVLSYDRDIRYAGETHYTIFKMIQLAIAGVTGFTIKPLVYTVYVAIVVSLMLVPAAIFLAWTRLSGDSVISPGLTFVGIVIIIAIGLQFIVLAVIALYIARIAIEIKNRPVYIIDTVTKTSNGEGS
jgi:dolichol-phosphate mannosyltransferase